MNDAYFRASENKRLRAVIFVAPPYFMLNAWDIWQKCGNPYERRAWKDFWADIVLHVKTNPGRAIFFEELCKEAGLKKETQERLVVSLPVAVKKLLKASCSFDRDRWSKVIGEWAEIKPDLKVKTQAAILRDSRLIKDFLLAALERTGNPRLLAAKVAGESGLPKRYPKSDVLLMFCSIVAESLSAEIIKEGFDGNMDKSIFQLADDAIPADADGVRAENRQSGAGKIAPAAEKPKSFAGLWDEFLRAIGELDPLSSDWAGSEVYLSEAASIASRKSEERAAILRRRALIDDFAVKTGHILNTFSSQLRYIGFDLPAAETAGKLPDNALEACVDALSGLTEALRNYKELSAEKRAGFVEDKKRIGLLLSTMTDIEKCMEEIGQILTVELSAGKEEIYASEQDETLAARVMLTAPDPDSTDAEAGFQPPPAGGMDSPPAAELNPQIELFPEKEP